MPSLAPFRIIDPVDQAEVLLTVCEDDLQIAHATASYNFQHAGTESEAQHWFGVLVALTPSSKAQA